MGLRIEARIPKGSDIIQRIKGIKNASNEIVADALSDVFDESIDELRQYPPETSGNQPPPPYYKRGTGMMQRVKGGGERVRKNRASDDLKNKWGYEVSVTDSGVTGTIENTATNPGWVPYAGYVHGSPTNDPPQTVFHGRHGHLVAVDVIKEKTKQDAPIIQRIGRRIKNFFDRG